MFCAGCGCDLKDDVLFCPTCGTKQTHSDLGEVAVVQQTGKDDSSRSQPEHPIAKSKDSSIQQSHKQVSYKLKRKKFFCHNCGSEISYAEKFCPKCGTDNSESIKARAALTSSVPFEIVDTHSSKAVACLFFCLPLGLIAIFLASQVDQMLARNDIEGAKSKANQVLVISLIGIASGVLIGLLLLPSLFSGMMTSF